MKNILLHLSAGARLCPVFGTSRSNLRTAGAHARNGTTLPPAPLRLVSDTAALRKRRSPSGSAKHGHPVARSFCLTIFTIAVVLLLPAASNAHDSGIHAPTISLRLWKDAAGKPIHEGSFVAARDKELIVQDREGAFIAIDLDRLGETDRALAEEKLEHARERNTRPIRQTAAVGSTSIPSNSSGYLQLMESAFGAFAPKVRTRSDARHFFVESDSIPGHQMMVGITAWQQQVPLPQPYTGANAWQIPLHPVKAARPMSAKEHFFRGAIALAVNGVPIFNPIKNDGRTDTLKAGELDKWGGHCGRADDYHYHIAPTHLQAKVGPGAPVAFALDGYPVFGFSEPDGSPARDLDWMGGHTDADGKYHYHAMKTYPYLVGGFRGEVREVGGQVDPQPRAQGVRPYTQPLRGARIVDFKGDQKTGYSLKYSQNGRAGFVNYRVQDNGKVTFSFIGADGRNSTETFSPRERGKGGDPRPDNRRGKGKGKGKGGPRPPRPDGDRPPPPRRPQDRSEAQPQTQPTENPDRRRDGNESDRRRERGQGAGNLILAALDTDHDGELSPDELRNAPAALRSLDRNGDGELSREETRGPGERGQRGVRENTDAARPPNRPPSDNRATGRGGPPPEGERKPWIAAHLAELDADEDGSVSRAEMLTEAARTFAGYDLNGDGQLSEDEYRGRANVRSAMGGFVKAHSAEFDQDGNRIISREEVDAFALRMFTKADADRNNIITHEEANTRSARKDRRDQPRKR